MSAGAIKFAFNGEGKVFQKADFKRVLRKTDLYTMPLFCFLYACQFMDKNNILCIHDAIRNRLEHGR